MLQFPVRSLSIRFKLEHKGEMVKLTFSRPRVGKNVPVSVKVLGPDSFVVEDVIEEPTGTTYVCTHEGGELRFSHSYPIHASVNWFNVNFDTHGIWMVGIDPAGSKSKECKVEMSLVRTFEESFPLVDSQTPIPDRLSYHLIDDEQPKPIAPLPGQKNFPFLEETE